ncbi:DEP domain-containing protein 1A-like isoform X2 [Periplaneta americana]|uniref:DEP domain-containing protein 1A-like isoform X2 n=1 Tax=Periplaneta americana TaxID=6978 RepID=UPI0037E813A6
MEGGRNCGPYKATKMWNDMVETFREGIPLKKHRRHIKVYENCFTGQEAVNWFQTALQNNLHVGNVTKEQTIQLLNKFLKAGIFQNVNATSPFDTHYQFLKESDLYQLSDNSSTRLPLVNKSQNIPAKLAQNNQWSLKTTNTGTSKKMPSPANIHSEMIMPRLDAHHTVGLPNTMNSVQQQIEGNCNYYTSKLSLPDKQARNKIEVVPRRNPFQNMQYVANDRSSDFNQMPEVLGSIHYVANTIEQDQLPNNYHRYPAGPGWYNTISSNTFDKHCRRPSNDFGKRYSVSPSERMAKENRCLGNEKLSSQSPFNRDTDKNFGGGRPHKLSYDWLDPLTLDSVDTHDGENINCISNSNAPNMTAGHKRVETLPRTQSIQRSASMIQPRLDYNKPYMYDVEDPEKTRHNRKLPQSCTDVTGLGKHVTATIMRSPYTSNGNATEGMRGDGTQVHHYHSASSSQLQCNQGNAVTSSLLKEDKGHFKRCGSLGFSRPGIDTGNQISKPVNELHKSLETGDMWKRVLVTRFEKLTPGLEYSFRFELQHIPGEWIAANASSKVLYHDTQFPQSLVAAMNCLVHWPQAVPNEIITAFKEHYFKLQEPLTTFKLYNVLTKVFLYVATGNLAMSKGLVSRQSETNAGGLLSMVLPPNSCFETAFTSDSPVTRIVPQRSVDTLHFSRHARLVKNIPPKRISSAPNLIDSLSNAQAAQKQSGRSGTKRQVIGRRAIKLANRKSGRRVRIGMEEDSKLCHFRNKSGGYVNPALSRSIDDVIETDDFADAAKMRSQFNIEPDQELDYIAALESLNTLMRCSRRDPSVSVGRQCVDGESDIDQNGSSESSSYYTAVSSSSSEASSRRSSGVLGDSLENMNTREAEHVNIGETGEKLMVTIMQLLLLCIPVYNRIQLRYLLHFMNQWNMHQSLCVQTDVVDIFTPTILRSECDAEFDVALARSIVYFLMSHCDLVLTVPSDLETEVEHAITQQRLNNVSRKDVKDHGSVTFCQQVSSRQFEQQRLTGSQLALSELLEQILSDCKMGPKEKRKRLKMFQESYPHIYHRRFPDSAVPDKPVKKQTRGLLNLATLSRLKSLRV